MGALTTDLNHERLWAAIDAIAAHNGLSPSALARRAGLSSTAFNRSKRVTADGRPRWPSTESIAKILATTGADLDDLVRLIAGPGAEAEAEAPRPLVRFHEPARASVRLQEPARPLVRLHEPDRGTEPGFAEDGAAPGAEATKFPGFGDEALFAFSVADDEAAPLYRRGDVLIASTEAPARHGDRVLVCTTDGGVAIRLYGARNSRSIAVTAPTGRRRRLRLASADVLWIARILWASQ